MQWGSHSGNQFFSSSFYPTRQTPAMRGNINLLQFSQFNILGFKFTILYALYWFLLLFCLFLLFVFQSGICYKINFRSDSCEIASLKFSADFSVRLNSLVILPQIFLSLLPPCDSKFHMPAALFHPLGTGTCEITSSSLLERFLMLMYKIVIAFHPSCRSILKGASGVKFNNHVHQCL